MDAGARHMIGCKETEIAIELLEKRDLVRAMTHGPEFIVALELIKLGNHEAMDFGIIFHGINLECIARGLNVSLNSGEGEGEPRLYVSRIAYPGLCSLNYEVGKSLLEVTLLTLKYLLENPEDS